MESSTVIVILEKVITYSLIYFTYYGSLNVEQPSKNVLLLRRRNINKLIIEDL
jgi:hypothetical protein